MNESAAMANSKMNRIFGFSLLSRLRTKQTTGKGRLPILLILSVAMSIGPPALSDAAAQSMGGSSCPSGGCPLPSRPEMSTGAPLHTRIPNTQLSTIAGGAPETTSEPMVVDVRITGNRAVPTSRILSGVKTRTGRELNDARLEDDVRRLMQTGMFVKVTPYKQEVEGGVVVQFEVVERPIITEIKFIGNLRERRSTIEDKAGLKVGDSMDPVVVSDARRRIEQHYHSKGYSKARVTIAEGNRPQDRRAIFLINEGPRQKIWWTQFEGNTIVSDQRLKTQIESTPGVLWMLGGEVDYDKIAGDENRIKAYYKKLGYHAVRVGRIIKFNEERTWMTLTFVIHEGPQFKIRNVRFIGNKRYNTDYLMQKVELVGGQPFNQLKLQEDTEEIKERYGRIGHVFASIEPELRYVDMSIEEQEWLLNGDPRDEHRAVQPMIDVVYNIKEGDCYHVGRIDIEIGGDNPHTQITTLLNRTSLKPGDIVDIRKLRDSERRFRASGLFLQDMQRGLQPRFVLNPPEPDELNETQLADRDTQYRGQNASSYVPTGPWRYQVDRQTVPGQSTLNFTIPVRQLAQGEAIPQPPAQENPYTNLPPIVPASYAAPATMPAPAANPTVSPAAHSAPMIDPRVPTSVLRSAGLDFRGQTPEGSTSGGAVAIVSDQQNSDWQSIDNGMDHVFGSSSNSDRGLVGNLPPEQNSYDWDMSPNRSRVVRANYQSNSGWTNNSVQRADYNSSVGSSTGGNVRTVAAVSTATDDYNTQNTSGGNNLNWIPPNVSGAVATDTQLSNSSNVRAAAGMSTASAGDVVPTQNLVPQATAPAQSQYVGGQNYTTQQGSSTAGTGQTPPASSMPAPTGQQMQPAYDIAPRTIVNQQQPVTATNQPTQGTAQQPAAGTTAPPYGQNYIVPGATMPQAGTFNQPMNPIVQPTPAVRSDPGVVPAVPGTGQRDSGLFQPDSVFLTDPNDEVLTRPLNTRPLDMQISAQETQTGRLQFGVGVNSDAGLVGSIVLDEQNFDWQRWPNSWDEVWNGVAWRGAGQHFRMEAIPGTEVQRYMVQFNEPYLMDTNVSFGISGSYYNRLYLEWDEERLGGTVSFGYQFTHDLTGGVTMRMANVDVYNPVVNYVPQINEVLGSNSLFGFLGSLTHDTRDSPYLATEGHMLQVAFEQVVGSFVYPRVDVDYRKYITLGRRIDNSGHHILSLSCKGSWTGSDTPVYDHYFAGGFTTIRGFDFRGASPVVGPDNVIVGGEFQLLASAQYMFPISANDMLRGVVFCDAGTVEPTITDWSNRFRAAVGFGFRISVPMMGPAPIAFDFAFPVSKEPTDRTQVFSFFVGMNR